MKAAIRTKYGGPEVLSIQEVLTPKPALNELLIKVFTTTVNRTGCAVLSGKPFIMRFFTGLFNPTLASTGTDFAGVVEAVGTEVSGFTHGDRVFGFLDIGIGSHAEYLTLSADKPVAKIPNGVSFEDAVASIEGAHYARNFLNKVEVTSAHKVMLNGATGAIGSAMLQLLKNEGIYVVATANTPNLEKIKDLGADRVIDFTTTDFTKDAEKFDLVLDSVGKSTFGKSKAIMKEEAVYISSELGPWGQNPIFALTTKSQKQKVIFPVPTDIRKSLEVISDLLAKDAFRPLIDRVYSLDDIREAFTYVSSGQKTGNVVIKMV